MCHYAILAACRPMWISIIGQARFSLSSTVFTKSYYEVLGVTPHATQNDIKTAYYKLSKQYHPDKNTDSEEAINKFRVITEAYEVLGNFRLKKMYDKGLLHTAGPQYSNVAGVNVEDDADTKFYKSRLKRDKPPSSSGRTPIYNFDEWSRAHYEHTFVKQNSAREMRKARNFASRRLTKEKETEKMMMAAAFIVMSYFIFNFVLRENYDVDVLSSENENKDEDDGVKCN